MAKRAKPSEGLREAVEGLVASMAREAQSVARKRQRLLDLLTKGTYPRADAVVDSSKVAPDKLAVSTPRKQFKPEPGSEN